MTQHVKSNQNGQFHQQNQHNHAQRSAFNQPRQAQPSYASAARRDALVRRKLDLEMEAQDLLSCLDSLDDQWIALHQRKAILRQQVPSLKAQVVLSGVFGIRQTSAERLFEFQVSRIMQEEVRIEQQKIHCSHQIGALNAKMALLDSEIDLLP
ncbi:MAG: hypothetical protein ABI413_21855 [Ktedonobacteraceae bacterium]